jgi:hypothetical protein
MSKDTIPADYDGEMLAIGNYVKYDGKTWEVVDHVDSEQPAYDDNYTEHTILLLACRSHEVDNIWIPDYEVEQTDNQQLYFNL